MAAGGKYVAAVASGLAKLYTAIARQTVLVMAAQAACAVTAALLRDRTDTQAPPPVRPDQSPPADLGMIPLTVPEITHLLTTRPARPGPPGHARALVGLAAPPPGPLTLVPPAHPPHP